MSDYKRLLDCLDPWLTLVAIADLKAEAGDYGESKAWRALAEARRYPAACRFTRTRWRWYSTGRMNASDRLPRGIHMHLKGRSMTVGEAFEDAVQAMMESDKKGGYWHTEAMAQMKRMCK